MVEFAVLFFFVVVLGVWLLWTRRTISAALVYAVLAIMFAAGLVEMQARPKPANLEWRSPESADVLWSKLVEGQALYFILQMPSGPRLYVRPWVQEQGEQLLRAGKEAERTGGSLKMKQPFESSLAPEEQLFYAKPQPALPPKG